MEYFKAYEERMIDFFKKIIETENKNPGYKFVFLSERFMEVYKVLLKKHPEIKLPNESLYEREIKSKDRIIYLNDACILDYECPKYINNKSIVLICNKFEKLKLERFTNIPSITLKDIKNSEKEINYHPFFKKQQLKFYKPKYKQEIYTPVRESGLIHFISLELQFLADNGYENVIALSPEYLKNYFYFYAYNKEQIEWFLTKFYQMYYLLEIRTTNDRLKLKNDLISKMITLFGEDSLTTELKLWLVNTDTKNAIMLHHPITNKGNNLDINCFRKQYLTEKIGADVDTSSYEEEVDNLFEEFRNNSTKKLTLNK